MRLREQAASGGARSGCMGLLDLGREEAVSGLWGSSCCAGLLTCAVEKPVSGKAPAARRCMLIDALLVARFFSFLSFWDYIVDESSAGHVVDKARMSRRLRPVTAGVQ